MPASEKGTINALKAMRVANGRLLRAWLRHKRRRVDLEKAARELDDAKRNVELLIQALQPELPDRGDLPSSS